MIIELAGAPGAGETTLGPQILSTLRSFDADTMMVDDVVRPVVRSTVVGRLLRPLPPGGIRRALEWRRVLYWLVRAIGAAQFLSPSITEDRVVVVDEGAIHRVVQLFTSPLERADRQVISRYVAQVPHPDVVVIVDAPPDVCADRAIARGGRDQWGWSEDDDVRAYVSNAHEAIQLTCRALRMEGVPVVVFDSAGGVNPGWAVDLERAVSRPGRRVDR